MTLRLIKIQFTIDFSFLMHLHFKLSQIKICGWAFIARTFCVILSTNVREEYWDCDENFKSIELFHLTKLSSKFGWVVNFYYKIALRGWIQMKIIFWIFFLFFLYCHCLFWTHLKPNISIHVTNIYILRQIILCMNGFIWDDERQKITRQTLRDKKGTNEGLSSKEATRESTMLTSTT